MKGLVFMSKNFITINDVKSESAIIFVHGFTGASDETWSDFFKEMKADENLSQWATYSIGFPTHKSVQRPGWSKDPNITTIAGYLGTNVKNFLMKKYKSLVFVAHSMGGLVTQCLCTKDKDIREKTFSIVNYGTPSNGLKKASIVWALLKKLKISALASPQIEDMQCSSEFIKKLRDDWGNLEEKELLPSFLAVAGLSDDFVPVESSLNPFQERQRAIIPGNHLEIVRPDSIRHDSVDVLHEFLSHNFTHLPVRFVPGAAAESIRYEELLRTCTDPLALDDEFFAEYIFALENTDNMSCAIELLEQRENKSPDLLGILAGRYKREWLQNRKEIFAIRALSFYERGYRDAAEVKDYARCCYLAINIAFLKDVYNDSFEESKDWAQKAMSDAQLAGNDKWAAVTTAEAYYYLEEYEKGESLYESSLKSENFSPREMMSIISQLANYIELTSRPSLNKRDHGLSLEVELCG